VFVFLSPQVLVVLAGLMAVVLIWEGSRAGIPADALPWAMIGMGLVAVAMGILLVWVPGSEFEQALRGLLLLEGCAGVFLLNRRLRRRDGDDRR
jgi:apolipoprotein N-acyltransferase